ncbi:PspC domain-containing protein [Levilactobacillus suantsaii]|uniref:PspC domain-containing protein n=1 Tax=Levilactobacillus suantsaii TaxID=2292255 RepID=A0A4V1LFP2_9LACO|nr:PspC domain-containing protein [Levilactobacillus suantsaii]QMU07132.1 PspC domain-containing protein [Levilactobacillus suantsaii]RXI80095.1 PspC domain-containing protein [Levilactobacillus suantsaii]
MAAKKRLVRSRTNRLVGGVLGGITEYFGWNANLLRLIYVIITISIPFAHVVLGLLVYVILMTFIPLDDTPTNGPNLSDLFGFGRGTQASQKPGRKVIHDVKERDVHHENKDGD